MAALGGAKNLTFGACTCTHNGPHHTNVPQRRPFSSGNWHPSLVPLFKSLLRVKKWHQEKADQLTFDIGYTGDG